MIHVEIWMISTLCNNYRLWEVRCILFLINFVNIIVIIKIILIIKINSTPIHLKCVWFVTTNYQMSISTMEWFQSIIWIQHFMPNNLNEFCSNQSHQCEGICALASPFITDCCHSINGGLIPGLKIWRRKSHWKFSHLQRCQKKTWRENSKKTGSHLIVTAHNNSVRCLECSLSLDFGQELEMNSSVWFECVYTEFAWKLKWMASISICHLNWNSGRVVWNSCASLLGGSSWEGRFVSG